MTAALVEALRNARPREAFTADEREFGAAAHDFAHQADELREQGRHEDADRFEREVDRDLHAWHARLQAKRAVRMVQRIARAARPCRARGRARGRAPARRTSARRPAAASTDSDGEPPPQARPSPGAAMIGGAL